MVTPELLAYIKTELAKGKSREQIEKALIEGGGWSKDDIEEAIRELTPPTPVPPPAPVVPPAPEPVRVSEPVGLPVEPMSDIIQQPLELPTEPKPAAPEPMPPQLVQSGPLPAQTPHRNAHYAFWGFIGIILVTILQVAAISANPHIQSDFGFVSKISQSNMELLLVMLVTETVFAGIGSIVLHRIVKLFKNMNGVIWDKALFAIAAAFLINAICILITALGNLSLSAVFVIGLLEFLVQAFIVSKVYFIGARKAVLITLATCIALLLISFLFRLMTGSLHPGSSIMTVTNSQNIPSLDGR